MARCGCAGTTCSCAVEGGSGVEVTGTGTVTNPYVVSVTDPSAGGGVLTVLDTDTLGLTLTGDGSTETPYLLSGDVTMGLGELVDVVTTGAVDGNVLAWNGSTWAPVPATTAPVGAIAVGEGLLGDGSSGDPLRVDPDVSYAPPTGSLLAFLGTTAPLGWLLAAGQGVSRVEYADLFDVIGTMYGVGDGSTTFNLPDLRDRFVQGASGTTALGSVSGAGTHSHSIPAHTHTLADHTHGIPAHSHSLSDAGVAALDIASYAQYARMATYSPSYSITNETQNSSVQWAGGAGTRTRGIALRGATDAATLTTSAGGAGSTGASSAASSGVASSLPPNLAVNWLIRY